MNGIHSNIAILYCGAVRWSNYRGQAGRGGGGEDVADCCLHSLIVSLRIFRFVQWFNFLCRILSLMPFNSDILNSTMMKNVSHILYFFIQRLYEQMDSDIEYLVCGRSEQMKWYFMNKRVFQSSSSVSWRCHKNMSAQCSILNVGQSMLQVVNNLSFVSLVSYRGLKVLKQMAKWAETTLSFCFYNW